MENHRTRSRDLSFFREIFSRMAYGQPDNFYDQISDIAAQNLPRRVEIGFGSISDGYLPLGNIEIGPFVADQLLAVRRRRLLESFFGELLSEEGGMNSLSLRFQRDPSRIFVNTAFYAPFPFGVELRVERYLDVKNNFETVDPNECSLDFHLEREARMTWYIPDDPVRELFKSLPDKRI